MLYKALHFKVSLNMDRNIFIYFGDDLFHKLECFIEENSLFSAETVKHKVFLKSLSNSLIDDVYLGWSYIVYRVGKHLNFT